MSDPLRQLSITRELRREISLGKVAAAKQRLGAAQTVFQRAWEEFEASRQWRIELLESCALGAAPTLRESTLPACEALIEQRRQACVQAHTVVRAAIEHLANQRQDLSARERDLLRVQEWGKLKHAQDLHEAARQENHLDDERLTSPSRPRRIA